MSAEAQFIANQLNAQKSTSTRSRTMSLGLTTAKRFAKTSTPADCFMQNKANLLDAQMSVSSVLTKYYENERLCRCGENKPKQTRFLKILDNLSIIFAVEISFLTGFDYFLFFEYLAGQIICKGYLYG